MRLGEAAETASKIPSAANMISEDRSETFFLLCWPKRTKTNNSGGHLRAWMLRRAYFSKNHERTITPPWQKHRATSDARGRLWAPLLGQTPKLFCPQASSPTGQKKIRPVRGRPGSSKTSSSNEPLIWIYPRTLVLPGTYFHWLTCRKLFGIYLMLASLDKYRFSCIDKLNEELWGHHSRSWIIHTVFLMFSGFVYPVVCHWAWAPNGWLGKFGYKDFAGNNFTRS